MQTPTKKVKRGRKSASESANDYCRLCNCALKIRFGNFDSTSYVSFENIFKCSKTSKITQTLEELCSDLGFLVEKSSVNSDRVCKACARKVRNAYELFHFIKTAFVNGKPSQDEVDKTAKSTTHRRALAGLNDGYQLPFALQIVAHKLRKL
jgi:hypothetical protein